MLTFWIVVKTHHFSTSLCVQTGGIFPGGGGGKARPERDADHSPPSSAKVVNE
jgi:hypothetical protein